MMNLIWNVIQRWFEMSKRRIVLQDRNKIFNDKEITEMDIMELVFRPYVNLPNAEPISSRPSINPMRAELISKVKKMLSTLINNGGKLEIERAAKLVGYDFKNTQDKHHYFFNVHYPLMNAGLISEVNDPIVGEPTGIKTSAEFVKLMDNFGKRWCHWAKLEK
jgi:hypothetical protein